MFLANLRDFKIPPLSTMAGVNTGRRETAVPADYGFIVHPVYCLAGIPQNVRVFVSTLHNVSFICGLLYTTVQMGI